MTVYTGIPPLRGRAILTAGEWERITDMLNLSDRELQVVHGVFDNCSERGIASEIGISPHTVHTHFERLYRKLSVTDRVQLVLRVFETHMAPGPRASLPQPTAE